MKGAGWGGPEVSRFLMKAQLIPLDGGPPIDIVRDITLVGRKEYCDLCVPDQSISKAHCVIVKTDGLLLVRDLASTNGTKVNGQRIRRAALLPGDELQVAGLKFRVHLGPSESVPVEEVKTELMTEFGMDPEAAAERPGSPSASAPPPSPPELRADSIYQMSAPSSEDMPAPE